MGMKNESKDLLAAGDKKLASVTPQIYSSKSPHYAHQIVDFADDGASARIQVVLHTESGKEGQDQFRQGIRIHLWALDLNILGDKLL